MPRKKPSSKPPAKKRVFSVLELDAPVQESTTFSRAKAKKPEAKVEPRRYFLNVADCVIENILSFLPYKTYFRLKLVSKEFHRIASRLFTCFDLEYKPYIPVEILQTMMQNSGKPEVLSFGFLRNFSADVFSKTIVPPLNLKRLNVLNFGKFLELNDEILLKCLKKTDFSLLSFLALPYNGRITNKSLDFIEKHFKNLEFFFLESKSLEIKEKPFQQRTLARILRNNECLAEFGVETLTDEFFTEIAGFESFSLETFRVRSLNLQEIAKIDAVLVLGKAFPYLSTLILKEIYVKRRMVRENRREISEFFNNLTRNLHFLTILKLGHFTTPEILRVLSLGARNLEYFKVESENLAIPEVQMFFLEGLRLEKVSGCVGRDCNSVFTFTKELDLFHCQLNINLDIDLIAHF